MANRSAEAAWEGDLKNGSGTMKLGSSAFEGDYSFQSRFEDGAGTNPEELIGAAHAGCFSMALSNMLAQAGHPPERVHTTANVHLGQEGDAPAITRVELNTEATVPGLSEDEFQQHARAAKENCPVSKALAGGPDIALNARLMHEA